MSSAVTPRWGDLRSRSIWRWQLILAASTVAVVATYALLAPALFGNPRFSLGVIGIAVVTAATLLVPWHRVPRWGVALLPLVDIILIGLMSVGGETRASLLWVFPVCWLATYYRLPWLIGGLGVMASVLLIDAFIGGLTPELSQRALVLLLCLGFMGVTISVGSRRTRAFSLLLRRQFDQLDRTRKRAESQAERVAVLANTLDTGIARFDRDGVIFDANRAFLELYGAASMAEFTPTGATEYDDFRGKPVPPHRTIIALAAAGERFDGRRVWLYAAQGRWHALDVATRPVVGQPGEHATNLVVVRDVTTAVEAERDRRNVSSIVSHELRNPLTAIVGHAELLLERDELPDDVLHQLAVIDNAGQRMQQMITTALARFGANGDGSIHLDPVDLHGIAEAAIVAFSPSATRAQVMLSMALEPGCTVLADAFALRQAIDNVIGNAVKYTARGGTVHVSLHRGPALGEISLSVADTGIGMSEQDRLRITERGYRAGAARSSGIPGSGIGMALVADIVAEHDGRLDVTSTLGRGTTVTIVLPSDSRPTTSPEGMPV